MKSRKKTWESQGKYKSFNTGKPMILVHDKETGATVLEPLHRKSFKVAKKDLNDKGGFNYKRPASDVFKKALDKIKDK